MLNKISVIILAMSLSGCAVTRGFVTGVVGGPQVVDEVVHGEYVAGTAHSEIKGATHSALMFSSFMVLWPLTAAYGGASGIYGAYEFWKYERKKK